MESSKNCEEIINVENFKSTADMLPEETECYVTGVDEIRRVCRDRGDIGGYGKQHCSRSSRRWHHHNRFNAHDSAHVRSGKTGRKNEAMKDWRRGMKVAKKHMKHNHGRKGWKKIIQGKPNRENISVYMGGYMPEEVSVTLTGGEVKIVGKHNCADLQCRPQSVVHTYSVPANTESRRMNAVLYPKGMLTVMFLDATDIPIELQIDDDVTVATDAIAGIHVVNEN